MTDSDPHPLDPLSVVESPPLDAVTRDRIESGLRVQHASRQPTSSRRPMPGWLAVVPVVALALFVTLALVLRDEAAVAAFELRDARDVTVTLPDGDIVVDPADGFALIDGAVVIVGATGTATIDDVTLAPGAVVTVRDGRLVTDVVATTTTVDNADGAEAPPPSDAPPVVPPPTSTTPTTTPTTTMTVRPATPTTVADDPSRPSDRPDPPPTTTGPTEPPVDTVDPPSDTRPTQPPRDEPGTDISLALRVRRADGGINVAWNAEGVEEGWRVVVVRTTDGSEPLDVSSGAVVGEGRRGELTERPGDLPDVDGGVRYRVIVLDAGDGVVARGHVQTLAPPGS